ncbi:unnamed protein product [Effrenium voratum]|uniref:Uncharacterized protein n=1 Tax=Effrenium voratum TaxID=2562239 RepID=A0AA36JT98_9DINO|nr:unnamed protein product [Effrenium voratum]
MATAADAELDELDKILNTEVEADARHAEILLKAFGFNGKTKGVDMPEDKQVAKDMVIESLVMRMAYTGLAWDTENDWLRLKRAVRYLVKHPYLKKVFYEQDLAVPQIVAWSGDPVTRRSTTGTVVKNGEHTLMVKATTQKVVALCSTEAEYYGMCRTATLGEFMRGVAEFWTGETKPLTLKVDSSAAKAMAERRGVGRTRHVQARFLWLQMRVVERNVDKVKGTINDADLVTNVQPGTAIRSHLERLGYEAAERRGHKGLTF